MKNIIVVGGGASGLMAAYVAARQGANVTLLEKMTTLGRKLMITGKGRCNITNIASIPDIIKNMPGNGSFLYSALNQFTNQDITHFLRDYGVDTKIERGGRVFPVSDKAIDVVEAFGRALEECKVVIYYNESVKSIKVDGGKIIGVITKQGKEYSADDVILATGGASYPGTGSSGDGYSIVQALGHTIIPVKPSLIPLEVEEEWVKDLQGLSLKNVEACIVMQNKEVASEFGEMLFTHYGLSGPIILSLSKTVTQLMASHPDKEILVRINLKPAISQETLDKRIQRDFQTFVRKQLKNALDELLPQKLIPIIIDLAYLDPDKPVHQISKTERNRIVQQISHLTFTISGTRPIAEAIVTAGGISVKEINPKTMESKIIEGLYFAGEVIDIDGYTGGYNLQAAFSTGYVAGLNAASD